MNLSGLSATYPGYAAQEEQTAQTQQNQYKAREAAIKLLGAQVLGRALSGVPANGPQAPAPGQASVPSNPSPALPAATPPQAAPGVPPSVPSGPAPQPPASAPPATGGVPSEVSLQSLTQRILQTHPGIQQHPEVLLAALERAAPILDRQGKEDLAETRQKFILERIQIAKDRLEEAKRHHDLVSADKAAREDQVNTRLQTRQESGEDKFNRLHSNAPAVGVPSPDPSAPGAPTAPANDKPPVAALKPNIVTTFANGQKWTLGPDGAPKQVQ